MWSDGVRLLRGEGDGPECEDYQRPSVVAQLAAGDARGCATTLSPMYSGDPSNTT
jgi:hypothetical protein